MASTRLQLRSNVRLNELKIDPTGRIWSDDTLNAFINTAYTQIQEDWNFKWRENEKDTSFNLVWWTQEYDLPSDFNKMQLVKLNDTTLHRTTKVNLRRRGSFVSWLPSKYYIRWNKIWFDTIPNNTSEIELYYLNKNANFTSDTDESAYPTDFDNAIIKYVAYLAFSTVEGYENKSGIKLEEYNLAKDTLFSTYIFDNSDLPTWKMARWYYWDKSNVINF